MHAAFHSVFDIPSGIFSLRRERRPVTAGNIDYVKLRIGNIARRIFCGGGQRLAVVIFKFARGRAHYSSEYIIHGRGHSPAASEIFAQQYTRGISGSVIIGHCLPPTQEYLRHRLSETVDTLLDIADHKKIFFVSGDCTEYHILRLVDILILINKYLGIA